MALPLIHQTDDEIGFVWQLPDGSPATLGDVIDLPGAEANRWLPTHLEALDDTLIQLAKRYGEILGGGRGATSDERADLVHAHRMVDRLSHEYHWAQKHSGLRKDIRAGQIIGTGALMSIRLRASLQLMGPAPFDGELDVPGPGVVGGQAGMHLVDPALPWLGGRWLVVTDDGLRLPATLSMLLFDSSGVDKEATLTEHRDALKSVTDAATGIGVEPLAASGAVDWLLFDWLMAHRDGPDSGAVEIKSGRLGDSAMIVAAAAASAEVRSRFDLGLLDLPQG